MWRYMASTSATSWGVGFLAAAAIQRRPRWDVYQVLPSTLRGQTRTLNIKLSQWGTFCRSSRSLPLDASDQEGGPRLVHAQAPASVGHLLQLFVLEPQPGALLGSLVFLRALPRLLFPLWWFIVATDIHPLGRRSSPSQTDRTKRLERVLTLQL